MKKVLFSHSYFLHFDPKQWKTGQPYPPLGTITAAAVLRDRGYEVSLFDTMFIEDPKLLKAPIQSFNPDILVLYDDGFNYLTKMCLTNMREAAFEMIKIARELGCTVIVSSSDSTDHFEKYLNKGADFVLIGEAELTLLDLVDAIASGKTEYNDVSGLTFTIEGKVIKTSKRAVMTELDALPMPAWDLINIKPYREMWMKTKGYFSINMSTTRGCPFKCNWCAKPIYGNRYNTRSPEHVIAELKYLKKLFNFDHIWFCDDIFGLKPGWLERFADLVFEESLTFRFKIQSRADLLQEEDTVKSLARAGCDDVWIGAESGSQKILDAMDKGITVDQIYAASKLLRNNNIKTSFFIQFGYLGESKDDILLTIRMINDLLPDDIGISVSYPLPGTVFYNKVKADLGLKTNWTDSDELQLMFKNTYRPEFYKQLHRYVHKSYHLNLSRQTARRIFSGATAVNYKNVKNALALIYFYPVCILARRKLKGLETLEN